MKANPEFCNEDKIFWAHIRLISECVGYTKSKRDKTIKIPTTEDVKKSFTQKGYSLEKFLVDGNLSQFGEKVIKYFEYRAKVLNETVQESLMNREEAKQKFEALMKVRKYSKAPLPKNKQKGEKKDYAFLTCIANMLIESVIGNDECNYDPQQLTTVTKDGIPLRTFARRVDGAFPRTKDPVAIWEIKEYYNTTSFGSRVADGVYETLLDGMEIEELNLSEKRKVEHILIIDAKGTWWKDGKSFLCRMIDMINMGYVDEVIFGREIFKRLPEMARSWKEVVDKTKK